MKPLALAVFALLVVSTAASAKVVHPLSPEKGGIPGETLSSEVGINADLASPEHRTGVDVTSPGRRTEGDTVSAGQRIEGDTIEESWIIPSLPFEEAGNTCGYADDYDEMCPYGASGATDVVYSYSPPYDMCVSVSLCDSYYDTKVYVYEDAYNPGVPVACNDDNGDCPDPPVQYTSWIEKMDMFAGHTYYVVVDGYGDGCGEYLLEMVEVDCTPCDVVCEGLPEGEPTCYDGYEDAYNGGCSSETYSYVPAGEESIVYCGESGIFEEAPGVPMRDTDWYLIYSCGEAPITVSVVAEFDVQLIFVDLRDGCEGMTIYSYAHANPCETAVLSEVLPHGQFAIHVAPEEWLPEYECGVEYSMTIEGYTEDCGPTPVNTVSWGTLKALYR